MKFIKILSFNLFFFLILLLILDNFLYFTSPLLPKKIVKLLSYKAQINYKIKNDNKNSLTIFDEHIYYYSPNKKHPSLSDGLPNFQQSDEYGYINPKNYLDEERINFILIGDSATESQDFSNEMRNNFNGKVYSLGIGGQGIFHWKYQYQRISKIHPNFKEPKNILLLFDENDIEDTIRALKYFNKGYTSSAYYPQNYFNDFFGKIDRKFSFYHEIYSIFRYFVASTQIRSKIGNYLESKDSISSKTRTQMKKLKIISEKPKEMYYYLNYDNDCIIRGNYMGEERVFDQNKTKEVADEINKMLELVNFKNTNVFFSYNPSVNTIYNLKLEKNNYILEMAKEQNLSSKNFQNFFKDKKAHYIDVTNEIRLMAKSKALHPCNGKDSHLSVFGYKVYTDLLSDKVKSILAGETK